MKTLIAANWKMFKTWEEGVITAREILVGTHKDLPEDREVLIIPPFTLLKGVGEILLSQKNYSLGGQNFYPAKEGAFTGEISPVQLLDLGCSYALVGHSERRHILGEKSDFLASKVKAGLEAGLKIIFCIGETLEERKAGKIKEVLTSQLEEGLKEVEKNLAPELLTIAYEPVWAIGTGEVAGEEDILEAHALIRDWLKNRFASGDKMRILYGGSVKPDNAAKILSLDNVNGVLVGGASLKAESFNQIILA
ncbi:MAG: Triosephosphate isomerase [Desulfonauticus sp. 38_4375]|nr:MAG: Triosephosphate isomerase [Desulfonauticus sp. 38_4375]